MKNDEFAFFNQQLAAMVRDGIPLEAALRRLCADMRRGKLRNELEKLEADLAKGTPLREAARARDLPELYRRMLEVATQSNDLPGILTMLADHYQRRHVISTRLKGLMVYPAIVLCGTFILACLFIYLGCLFKDTVMVRLQYFPNVTVASMAAMCVAPSLIAIALIIGVVTFTSPRMQSFLKWKVPAFKEASLAQLASAAAIMLKSGVPLDTALGLAQQLERGTPAATELACWRQRLTSGHGQFAEMTKGGKLFPPLFLWTVSQAHDDLGGGFQRAADVYQARASYRADMLLYSAMPCAVIILAAVIVSEMDPMISMLISMMKAMITVDGGIN